MARVYSIWLLDGRDQFHSPRTLIIYYNSHSSYTKNQTASADSRVIQTLGYGEKPRRASKQKGESSQTGSKQRTLRTPSEKNNLHEKQSCRNSQIAQKLKKGDIQQSMAMQTLFSCCTFKPPCFRRSGESDNSGHTALIENFLRGVLVEAISPILLTVGFMSRIRPLDTTASDGIRSTGSSCAET